MKNAQTKQVKFCKIKGYYFPVDAADYKLLRDHGLSLIRIKEDLMPTLGLLFKNNGIKPVAVSFPETIRDPYFDKLGSAWQAKEHRKATITNSVMKFETTHASVQPQAREALFKVEASLRRFFARWGFSHSFEISESRGKLKLHVQYKFDPERAPIIPLKEDATSVQEIRLNLGFLRITLRPMAKELEYNVAMAAGTDWNSLHTGRCLYSQISNVKPFIAALVNVASIDPHNADNKS